MRTLEERLAENLRHRRGQMSQRDFAKKLGVSVATLNRVENGQQNVSLKTLSRLCKRLKCDVHDLFHTEGGGG